ncbi:MAG: AAA family ATPase [Candidatus Eisenbacteria bacterium]|uniref:AAA family ATPase n=1 Tax=Eiseniibacteriota bacterium TaxID=2212470 RepID=A0A538SRR4_UNCEI|nr:MAG: AAA family ATPase [Candidatus Eisenbacteria bacterium]
MPGEPEAQAPGLGAGRGAYSRILGARDRARVPARDDPGAGGARRLLPRPRRAARGAQGIRDRLHDGRPGRAGLRSHGRAVAPLGRGASGRAGAGAGGAVRGARTRVRAAARGQARGGMLLEAHRARQRRNRRPGSGPGLPRPGERGPPTNRQALRAGETVFLRRPRVEKARPPWKIPRDPHRGLTDEAVIHLDHAASLFTDREDPALEHQIEAFQREVEQGLIEGTSAQSNEFAAFDEIRRVLRVEEGEGSLQEILAMLVRRSGAARGCVVAPATDGSATVLAAAGFSLRVAQDLLRELLARVGAERLGSGPVVSSRAGVDPRFRDFPASHALSPRTSLVIMPLSLPSGQAGFLYLDRPADAPLGAFKQREVNLIAALSNYISVAILEMQRRELARENVSLRGRLLGAADDHGIITRSRELLEIISLLERVGPSDATILIEGETGSGKGLLARAIHASSNRANRPLIQVNCAALPEPLLESELFGHVQGAFTGAVREKAGLFVEANGGTLFLDEVDKTTITIQGKLLQVLDNREVRPVGGNKSTKVDVRVLCATNVNLKSRIAKGEFLEDLYYRLNDICFRVPPLRERPEDIPLLVDHSLQRFAAEMGKAIHAVEPEVLRLFAELPWRGNVRELEKVIKRMVVLANDGEPLSMRLVPRELLRAEEEVSDSPATLKAEVAKVERKLIGQALERNGWNKLRAARALSLSYPTLLQKIKIYQLDRRLVIRQRS